MIIQYPHTLQVTKPADSSLINGNWSTGESTIVYESRCRIEPNASSQFIKGLDGSQIVFKGIIYMPLPVQADSTYIPVANTQDKVIYAGETVVHVVTPEESGGDTVLMPELAGKKFTLRLDILPLVADEYEVLDAGGFKVKGIVAPLETGQRFELSVYYEVDVVTPGGNGLGIGGDFFIKPGSPISVWWGNNKMMEDTVKQFSKGQLNARIWV